MCELSTADGFVEIHENVGDMIKYVANEPSVGLYYIQQHAQNAVPNLIRLKNNIAEKSHEVSLHTEDLEDSIAVTIVMKECGFPIIDGMIQDIKSSLTVMSTKQPVRGVIQQRNSSYQMGGSSSWRPITWARSAVTTQNDSETERAGSYFSSVFKSAKEKAVNLKWPQLDLTETTGGDSSIHANPQVLPPESSSSIRSNEADELPLSSQVEDEMIGGSNTSTNVKSQLVLSVESDFDEFKAKREARLEEWLKGSDRVLQKAGGEAEGHHQLDNS